MAIYLRKATSHDLPEILAIIEDGRQTLAQQQIPQWQNGDGPNPTTLSDDIHHERCYLMVVGEKIAGIGVLISTLDSAYEAIYNGQWQENSLKNYTAIHRVALKNDFQGHGLALTLLNYLVTAARLTGALDIRIDTHKENLAMQHLIKKAGFHYQGEVLLPVTDGERYAYQLLLS